MVFLVVWYVGVVVFVSSVFLFVDFIIIIIIIFEGVWGFVGSVALVLSVNVFLGVFYIGSSWGVFYFVFIIFMGWCYCVCFLINVGSPMSLGFSFGGKYLLLVLFCGVSIGAGFACVLLGFIWRVVIVFSGCISEFSIFVCWLSVCMFVIFLSCSGHLRFLAEFVSPLNFCCGGECLVLVFYMGVVLGVSFTCVV